MTDAHCHVAAPGATRRFLCPLEAVAQERDPLGGDDVVFWGVHPWYLDGPLTVDAVRAKLLADPRAGVGEIGLDRLRDRTISQAMRDTFVAQLKLALEFSRPVVLHGAKCWGQVVETIRQTYRSLHHLHLPPTPTPSPTPPPLLFHGFSRSDGLLPDIVQLNGYISVGPAVLNDHAVNYRALVRKIPADRLLLETDATAESLATCPPLADIAAKVAELRGVPTDELIATTDRNADSFVSKVPTLVRRTLLAILLTFGAGSSLAAGDWIGYPGDYGVWQGNRLMARRLIWTGRQSPSWGVYAHYPSVEFAKTLPRLDRPVTVRIHADGTYYASCSTTSNGLPPTLLGELTIPPGSNVWFSVRVFNAARPPALRIDEGPFRTDGSWRAFWHSRDNAPAETLAAGGDVPPVLRRLPTRPVEPAKTWRDAKGRLFADFGEETYGYLRLKDVTGAGVLKIVYAESLAEAEAEENDDGTQKTALDGYEYLRLAATKEHRRENPNGFRYVCVRSQSGTVRVGALAMDYEWKPVELRGAFRCDDDEINRIWDVSVRTLGLTRREVMVEGIKRDHWVWSGDAVQNFLMDYYTCADYAGVKDTLWAVRGKEPVAMHLNGIMDYTFYWFEAVRRYVLYSGDVRFYSQVYPRLRSLLEFALARLDGNGRPHDRPDDWIFIDWTPGPMAKTGGVAAFEQILLVRALEASAEIARTVGATDDAAAYAARAAKLKAEVKPLYWSEEKGALLSLRRDDGTLDGQVTRYPNMFGLFYGYFTDAEAKRVVDGVILNDAIMKIQTPYMRFYELEALCTLGLHDRVRREIKDYWGAMLKLGATSFWEVYNPSEKGREHYAMYGRDFGRSLCHAWGASPVYLFGRYFLGVVPTAPGYATYEVRPNLGGLKWMAGRVPTPKGAVEVSVKDGALTVKGAPDGTGTVVWKGRPVRVAPNATVKIPL